MDRSNKNHWIGYVIFGLVIFLLFCLVFESYLEPPAIVFWIGHWHPLILHFPIVLLLIGIFLGITGKPIPSLLLNVAALSALITAITGFLLGLESPNKGELLTWHQYLGSAVALLAALWYWLANSEVVPNRLIKGLQLILLVLVGMAGHYGGMVTHGEDFLAIPMQGNAKQEIPENPLVYGHVVANILEKNCVSCHNLNKQKGQLLLTSFEGLLAGGETGAAIVPGNKDKGELLRRLYLPKEDEEHMPPEDKRQLSGSEIEIIERWIALGAVDTLRFEHLAENEPLGGLIRELMEPDEKEKWLMLPVVADSTLQSLSSDYLTIRRISAQTNALDINVSLPPEYDPKLLVDLKRIAQNIVQLDLSGLPLGPKEVEMITFCLNIEQLEIDRTPLTDADLANLIKLNTLELLKVYGTGITDKSLDVIRELENLKSLYLWDTSVSEEALKRLKADRPLLTVNIGIEEGIQSYFEAKDSIP